MNTPTKPASPQTYTGADAVVACLKHQGVEVIFGMTGGSIMPVYDALFRDGEIKHIIVGHEQGAAHMAEGYARATGKVGVVMTTSGPGATNLVTGLADAFMDSTPMVAITGQVTSNLLGNDAFQEADMRGITMPITKHNYQVSSVEELPTVFAEAFFVALSGRPGPVLIDVPKDVMTQPCGQLLAAPSAPTGYKPPYRGHPQQIIRALKVLREAKQPVILAGGGIITAGAEAELKELAEAAGVPVTTSLMGLGAFPADHELCLGMPGMHGTGYANLALNRADLILCVGSRLDDRITGKLDQFAPGASFIHVDVDASEIGKNLPCLVPIVGDAKPVLREMAKGAAEWDAKPDYSAWRQQIDQWKERYAMCFATKSEAIAPQAVVQTLGQMLPEDAVIVTGVGQHQMYTAQFYPFKKPRTLITSGGLGTMGYGLPAAMGAKVGRPEAEVILIDGDGSFLMNIQELATAVRYRVGVVAIILNNNFLGMVRQWQELFLDKRQAETELKPPPYADVATAFGGLGRAVTSAEELAPAIEWARKEAAEKKLPVVLDVAVEREALVLPMVPGGAANVDFIPCPGQTKED
ncbi:MAG: biosynthetic-type acetolactate synthase large subunit [Desulfarculaceae bacterium]|nr:biosynthetic-type acetolactate synthase large subunit [Desulfarculaceae bacterium]MCF8073697.1 biosynthetic-type acetolactate synthase large subunit [Desulfarculaceae bacterium]MCF8101938.1 biosynthetic-type acetolactate synthase large subunit [Desulfarculaceae bacterium]MCF8115908.1 biosynthetic-type acetolactate synthase large subunit [Desulfarculaceae bacterium]